MSLDSYLQLMVAAQVFVFNVEVLLIIVEDGFQSKNNTIRI